MSEILVLIPQGKGRKRRYLANGLCRGRGCGGGRGLCMGRRRRRPWAPAL